MRQRTSFLFCAAVLAAVPSVLSAQEASPKPRVVGPPTAVVVGGPVLGGSAPQFTLPWATRDTTSEDSYSYSLTRDRGKIVVLTFYTQDFTPSATVQLQRLRDRAAEWGDDVVILGASIDAPQRHRRFASSLDLPFRLLSDIDQEVARAYGVRGSNGQPRRSVFVIGRDGTLKYSDSRFDPANSASYTKLDAAVAAARQ